MQREVGAHMKAVLYLGVPLIGGHLAQIAIHFTDTMMLGWYDIGAAAAITSGSAIFFALFMFGSGFALAVMPMVSSAHASGDHIGIRRITRMGLWLSSLFALFVILAFYYSEHFFRAFGQPEKIAKDAALYLKIAGWGMLPALGVMVLKSYLAALERTQIIFWITLIAAFMNAFVNWVLIFGRFGLPELGLAGAAIASVATQSISFLLCALYAMRVFPEDDLFSRLWRADRAMILKLIALGFPIGFTGLAEVGLFAVAAQMVAGFGEIPLAAHGFVLNIAAFAFMAQLGLANAATIRAGAALAHRDSNELWLGAVAASLLALGLAVCSMAAMILFPDALISIFISSSEPAREEILELGRSLLIAAALFQLFDAGQVMAMGLLRGIQDVRVPTLISFLTYWLIGLGTAWYFGMHLDQGAVGIWIGLVLGLMAAAILLCYRFWIKMQEDLPETSLVG